MGAALWGCGPDAATAERIQTASCCVRCLGVATPLRLESLEYAIMVGKHRDVKANVLAVGYGA